MQVGRAPIAAPLTRGIVQSAYGEMGLLGIRHYYKFTYNISGITGRTGLH